MGGRRPRNRLEPRNIGGEAGDCDPRIVAPDQVDQGPAQLRLGSRGAGPQRICRIADQCEDAFVAEPPQGGLVRGRADQRVRIELPVAGMQHGSDRRAQSDRIRFRDRMREGDQFEVERADREPARQRYDIDLDLIGEPGFGQLGAQERGGERGRPDRAAQLPPEIRNGPDMILMRMRRHDPEQAIAAFDDKAGIGHDDFEPRLRIVSEGDAAIDDQPVALIPVNIQVHPDFARAAERDKEERVGVAVIRPGPRLQRRMVHLLRFRR